MRRWLVWMAVIVLTCSAQGLQAADRSWNKIRYVGGTLQANVNPYDWNTTLTVTDDAIVLVLEHRHTIRILASQVSTLSYGQEAHRRVAEMVALSALASPLALFGILHKSKDHFVGIEYRAADGKPASVLLEAHKDNYRMVLDALKHSTGKPVENAP